MKQARRNLWRVGMMALLASASMVSQASAKGHFLTGNGLLNHCQDNSPLLQGDCMGFTSGVSDAMADAMASNTLNGWTACVPNQVTRGQVKDIAVQFLVKHPESRHFSASSLVANALHEAFPCPAK